MLRAEVTPARLLAMKRIATHQLSELEKVSHAPGVLQRLIQLRAFAWHSHVAPELLTQLWNDLERLPKAGGVARHSAVLPHHLAQLSMERGHGALALDAEQRAGPLRDVLHRGVHLGRIAIHGLEPRRRQIVAERVR